MLWAGVNGGCETFRVRAEAGTPFARHAAQGAGAFPLGAEGVGVVVAVGPEVTSIAPGQAVAVSGAACFAECVTAAAAACTPVPAATPAAVTLSLSGLTAAVALWHTGGSLTEGQAVLVTAAAGGTGHVAAQLAGLAGCRVFATCGGAEKAAVLRDLLGPQARVIDYLAEDVGTVLAAECPGGLAAAYEGVGGRLREAAIAALAPGGRLLAVGHICEYPNAAAGARAAPGPNSGAHDVFWGGKTVDLGQGRTLHGNVWAGADRRAVREAKARLFELHAEGKLKALIDQPPPVGLESAADGVERLLSGASTGKVVLRVWADDALYAGVEGGGGV